MKFIKDRVELTHEFGAVMYEYVFHTILLPIMCFMDIINYPGFEALMEFITSLLMALFTVAILALNTIGFVILFIFAPGRGLKLYERIYGDIEDLKSRRRVS